MFARPIRNSIRPPPASSYSRQQHIDSYVRDAQLAPSTRKVSADDTTFDTVFQSVAGDTLILRMHWPASAGNEFAPAMTLAGVEARHPWLDGRMRVTGYAPIQSAQAWNAANTLLGPAVHAVITHLQLNPPQIVRFVDPGLIAIQPKHKPQQQQQHSVDASHGASATQQVHSRSEQQPPPPAYDTSMLATAARVTQAAPEIALPPIPNSFPEMDGLDREQMEALVKNELDLKAFCNRLPITRQFQEKQAEIASENAKLAEERISHRQELNQLQEQVAQLQKTLQQKVELFQTYEKQQDCICKPPALHKVTRELQKAKRDAFDRSEAMAESWLESDDCGSTASEFVKNFVPARKVHHVRAAKLEVLERMPLGQCSI